MKKKKPSQADITPEWSHKVETDRIGIDPFKVSLTATVEQCRDVARRAGVKAVERLETEVTLQRASNGGLIHAEGTVKAEIIQDCSITLKELHTEVSDDFDAWYTDHDREVISLSGARRERDSLLSGADLPLAEEQDDPEHAVDGAVDVGELAAQYFCLAVDPYIQAPDSKYEKSVDTAFEVQPASKQNPFAALKNWKADRDASK